MKIVINVRRGGFGFSLAAIKRLIALNAQGIKSYKAQPPIHCLCDVGDGFKAESSPLSTGILYKDDLMFVYEDTDPRLRADPAVVQVVEELGDAANDSFSKLKVVEVPDDVNWRLYSDLGDEHIAEVHRIWV